jgi:biopolymer transport protein ExbB
MVPLEPLEAVREFVERGGGVLLVIGAVLLMMWTLMLERIWYFRFVQPDRAKQALAEWRARNDRTSWYAHQIRRLLVSEIRTELTRSISIIKTLVSLCPMLGLLGTVTGMIEVFDVMALAGSGNSRAMAAGVSKATIPTMAGMVAALSGLILSVQLDRFAERESERVADHLTLEPGGASEIAS